MRKKIICSVSISLIFLLFISTISFAKPKGPKEPKESVGKVNICHREGNGSYHLINIDENAKQAHLNHGDAFPGDVVEGGILSADCSLITVESLWITPEDIDAPDELVVDSLWNSPECSAVIESFKTAFYYPLWNNSILFGLDATVIPEEIFQLPFNIIETPVLVGAEFEGDWVESGVVNCNDGVCISTTIGQYSNGTPTNFTGTLEFILPNAVCRQTFENKSFIALMSIAQ